MNNSVEYNYSFRPDTNNHRTDGRVLKVFVTGATGFVGASLVSRLNDLGRFGVRAAVRSESGELLAGVEQVVAGDLTPNTDWQQALLGVDVVVHLAARVHVMQDRASDPLTEFRRVNVDGTLNLATQAAAAGVRRFIFISSIKVNGEFTRLGQVFTVDDVPVTQDPYGTSKWEAEQALHKVAEDTGLEVVILRPPLVYGPGVKANFLRLLDLVNKNIPLPLSMVNNKRSMLYIGNLVDAIIRCIEHPDAANQTFLVSDGQDVSTPELIRMIAKAMSKKARLFPCPAPLLRIIGKVVGKSAEVERLVNSLQIDSAKIRKTLNWTPPFTMEEGITKTVLSFGL